MLQSLYQESGFGVALVRAPGGSFTAVTRGCSATGTNGVSRTGVGDYTVNLAQGIPQDHCNSKVQAIGTTSIISVVEHTSDTAKRIRTFTDAGAAVDAPFDAEFFQLNP